MRIAIIRNEAGHDFAVPVGERGPLGGQDSLDVPRGISLQPAKVWAETEPRNARTGGGWSARMTLAKALAEGLVTVEERDVDTTDVTADAPTLAHRLHEGYTEQAELAHGGMTSSWHGAARRFGGHLAELRLQRIAQGKEPATAEDDNWLRAASVVVDQLYAEDQAAVA